VNLDKNKKLVLSIALNVLLALALSILLYLVYPQFIYKLESVENFRSYSVRTYRNWDNGTAYFEVLLGPEDRDREPQVQRRVYSYSGEVAFFVETFGADVTGDGVPDLVIQQWNGSASERGSRYFVLELNGSTVKEIAVIEGLAAVKRKDVNGDGVDELVGYDEAYRSFGGCCCADSPCPRVVLSFDRTLRKFALNKKLMAKPPLSEEQLYGLSLTYKDDPGWADEVLPPPGLFRTMFDLIYNGNEKQAWELLDASWPDGCEFSKQEWKRDVEDALRRSPYSPVAGAASSRDD